MGKTSAYRGNNSEVDKAGNKRQSRNLLLWLGSNTILGLCT